MVKVIIKYYNQQWIDKYKPVHIPDIYGNHKNVEELRKWLTNFEVDGKKKSALISGTPGIGKTSSVYAVARDTGYEIVELNASDTRSKKVLADLLPSLVQKTNLTRKYLILMDEIDGMSSADDKGGLGVLLDILNPLKGKRGKNKERLSSLLPRNFPIICTCNDRFSKRKLGLLVKECLDIHFTKPTRNEMYTLCQKILDHEKIGYVENDLLKIINFSQGDIRKMISTLEFTYKNTTPDVDKSLTIISKKDTVIPLFDATSMLFMNDNLSLDEITEICDQNKLGLTSMFYENYISFKVKNQKIKELEKLKSCNEVMDSLCFGDMIDAYIYSSMAWYFSDLSTIFSVSIPIIKLRKNGKTVGQVEGLKFSSSYGLMSSYNAQNNALSKLKDVMPNTDIYTISYLRKMMNLGYKDENLDTYRPYIKKLYNCQ